MLFLLLDQLLGPYRLRPQDRGGRKIVWIRIWYPHRKDTYRDVRQRRGAPNMIGQGAGIPPPFSETGSGPSCQQTLHLLPVALSQCWWEHGPQPFRESERALKRIEQNQPRDLMPVLAPPEKSKRAPGGPTHPHARELPP